LSKLSIKTAEVFEPLLQPARYKGAYGGRGSGKSHFFGELLVEECVAERGTLAVCIREVQKTLAQSSKRLIESKIQEMGVAHEGFRVFTDKIETPGDGIIIFQGMQDHTAESIKSLEGFRIADVEEAQTLSTRSLTLLRPTIRSPGSQIWFRWNPRRKTDAVDEFLRLKKPDNSIVVPANWRDNPFWTKELEDERLLDLKLYPERYEHIWEGDYAKAFEGAYYAASLTAAKPRIGRVAFDPLMRVRVYCDLGGTGAKADAFAAWPTQFIGKEIRVRDYYEVVGQPISAHINWLHSKGYKPERADIYLPHDGTTNDRVYDTSFESAFKAAGYDVTTIPNQGKGAARLRIESARRVFGQVWFDEESTEAGRDSLGYYHEKRDEDRNVGLGPDHDWSSHGADAFGLMCICYEDPARTKAFGRKINYPNSGVA
jgi:phage terminase large subunit